VRHDFSHGDALLRILLEHSPQEVPSWRVDVVWHFKVTSFDLLKQGADVVVIKRQSPSEKGEQDDTARPNVTSCSIIRLSCHDFRRCVMRAAARSLQHALVCLPCRHTKVCDLDILVLVEQQVLGLQIAVADIESVAIIDGEDDLLKVVQGLAWWQAASPYKVVEQLATRNVLDDEVARMSVNR
jgi:hypothetical protein